MQFFITLCFIMKTKTKESSLGSREYIDTHQESARKRIKEITLQDDLSIKQKEILVKTLLGEIKEEQGAEEFKKNMEIRKADYKKIREFVIERVGDPKKVTKEDLQEAVDFFYGKKESKEKAETPELEMEDYKIDA